ncbi:MAG: hypothetical protein AMXMBFR61_20440 [Fimbriimonadales bacterium]
MLLRLFVCSQSVPRLLAAVFLAGALLGSALAQTAELRSFDTPLSVDSGLLFNTEAEPALVWSETVYVPNADWVRLRFGVAILGDGLTHPEGSTLRITSLTDGAVQLLNARTIREWQNTSAYFNGPAVLLELIAAPNGMPNRIVITEATGGLPGGDVSIQSICGTTDDRQLSYDPRACRMVPVGCTGWMIDDQNRCMLTAGHCASGGSLQVAEFNVPLSNGNGSIVHPPPSDQYAVDVSSIQFTNGGVGNDWCYYGCFPNSTTGLTPYQAQGASYVLAATPPAVQGQSIRITGYGTVSSPVSPTWNQVQKTHVGPYVLFSGTQLGYATDTTGGNSGSPVINEDTGQTIGIHTHGGCTTTGGYNSGTGCNHSGLRNALANPKGVCAAGLKFEFPDGRPVAVSPSGGTTMRVEVVGEYGNVPQPGTGMFHYDTGSGFTAVPMTQTEPNKYLATFPGAPCGSQIRYYVSAETTTGGIYKSPASAPNGAYVAYSATTVTTLFEDNFQTNKGWTVQNSGGLTAGAWERAIPNGGGARGDPPTDYDGSGYCYVTQNGAGDTDVDGGSTYLLSPVLDLTGTDAVVSYARWFHNSYGANPYEDVFEVHVSNDNGASWVLVEQVGPTGTQVSGGWFVNSFLVSEFVAPTSTVRVRFTASDLVNGSVVEAGVDAFEVVGFQCAQAGSLSGRIALDFLDVSPAGIDMTIEFRIPGTTTLVESYPVVLDASGNYQIASVVGGTYDIAAKGGTWLRQVLPNQVVGSGTVADFSLKNGDLNDDGAVNLSDLNYVLALFGTTSGFADLTRNGWVDLGDLNGILANFGETGAP